jgi:hypothetical protein
MSPEEIKKEYLDKVIMPALELKCKKMHDYGVVVGAHKYGIKGIVHDVARKFGRIESLILEGKEAKISDESLYDTFIDLINYAMDGAYYIKINEDKSNGK